MASPPALPWQIEDFIDAIRRDQILVVGHADDRANQYALSLDEILLSVIRGDIIETYPDRIPRPRCLISGYNSSHEPIHSVWEYAWISQRATLITTYRPSPEEWGDWNSRRFGPDDL